MGILRFSKICAVLIYPELFTTSQSSRIQLHPTIVGIFFVFECSKRQVPNENSRPTEVPSFRLFCTLNHLRIFVGYKYRVWPPCSVWANNQQNSCAQVSASAGVACSGEVRWPETTLFHCYVTSPLWQFLGSGNRARSGWRSRVYRVIPNKTLEKTKPKLS